jgi:hypothetical protein
MRPASPDCGTRGSLGVPFPRLSSGDRQEGEVRDTKLITGTGLFCLNLQASGRAREGSVTLITCPLSSLATLADPSVPVCEPSLAVLVAPDLAHSSLKL